MTPLLTQEQKVQEQNELIAKFMGLKSFEDKMYGKLWPNPASNGIHEKTAFSLKYHSSWDWLMEVVEKISKMPLLNVDNTPCTDYIDTCYPITFNMPTEDGKVMFRFKGFSLHESDKLIDAVYAAVCEVAEYELRKIK